MRFLLPELIDRVIDHLHSDKDVLTASSLVCREWLPRSRFHLFRSMQLKLPLFRPEREVFLFTISLARVRPYVRELVLSSRADVAEADIQAVLLEILVKNFPSVHTMTFHRVRLVTDIERMDAVCNRPPLGSLRKLVISGLFVTWQDLRYFFALLKVTESLQILDIELAPFCDPPPEKPRHLEMKSLTVERCAACTPWDIANWVLNGSSCLESLDLRLLSPLAHPEEHDSIQSVLDDYGTHLLHLRLDYEPIMNRTARYSSMYSVQAWPAFDLTVCAALQTLHLRLTDHVFIQEHLHLERWRFVIILIASLPRSIRKVILGFPEPLDCLLVRKVIWLELADALSKLPNLELVVFQLECERLGDNRSIAKSTAEAARFMPEPYFEPFFLERLPPQVRLVIKSEESDEGMFIVSGTQTNDGSTVGGKDDPP
ncbi:unnamed protein product [Somion occarium]|uniref:F-box domain-containing protein n=1 Tax=Somion occarium TaxID=3059160 RepID=A0ABP1E8G1_9APHY